VTAQSLPMPSLAKVKIDHQYTSKLAAPRQRMSRVALRAYKHIKIHSKIQVSCAIRRQVKFATEPQRPAAMKYSVAETSTTDKVLYEINIANNKQPL
jgi:hypothetical protein